jgi:hypothetical protein
MATRMQQRRGTASQWISTNSGSGPILSAGEIGYESDTNKFKIGDGVNHWINLDYFIDANSTANPSFGTSIVFEGATADSYETTLQVTDPTDDRTITLPNVSGTVITTGNLSDITNIGVFTSTITMEGSSADDYELTLSAGNPTADRTITFPDSTGTVALTSDLSSYAPLNSPTFTGTVTLPANTISQSMMGDDSVGTNEIGGLAVTEAKIADGAVTSVKIANGTIVNEDINASAAIALSKLATDPLARANHTGTQTASTISDFDTQVRTSKVTDLTAPTGSFSMNSQRITSLGAPSASTDAATVAYVDAATAGLNVHAAVQAATTANITLASALENGDTLDGVTLATGNRVLVKNQTDKTENGVYVVKASGAPDRADDYNTAGEVDAGDFLFVEAGTANGKTGWMQTNVITTVGSDNIEFTQFSGAGTYTAGAGLTLNGTVFSANIGTDIQAYNSTLAAVAGGTYTGDDSITTLGTITSGTWTGTTIAIANGGTGATTASTAAAALLPNQASNSGKYLTTDGSGTLSWGTVSGYSAPTLGSTSISSGSTVTTISGLTLSGATLSGTLTAGGGAGTEGQVLKSTGSGVEWGTVAASGGAAFSELMLIGA